MNTHRHNESLRIATTAHNLDELHHTMKCFWERCEQTKPLTQQWRLLFMTALFEVIGNIITHAYDGQFIRPIELRIRLYHDRVVACLSDSGRAYHGPTVSTAFPIAGWDLLEENNRGQQIIAASLDHIQYRRFRQRNVWRLIKQFR